MADLRRHGIRMKVFPEHPTLVYRPFTVNKNNYIYLADNGRIPVSYTHLIHHKADLGDGEHHLVGRQSSSPDPSHHNGTETERSSVHSHLHGNGPSQFVQVQEVCPVECIV